MKCLSMGVKVLSKNPLKIEELVWPEKLAKLGFNSSYQLGE